MPQQIDKDCVVLL